jgi:hypothetical protein
MDEGKISISKRNWNPSHITSSRRNHATLHSFVKHNSTFLHSVVLEAIESTLPASKKQQELTTRYFFLIHVFS